MKLTEAEIADIAQLLRDADFEDLELEWGDVYLRIAQRSTMRRGERMADAAPTYVAQRTDSPSHLKSPTPAPAAPPLAAAASSRPGAPAGVHEVRSALMGTLYRAPQPGDPAFVEVGSTVKSGDTLCLLEVMKVFTAVKAETGGVIERILVSDGDLVEYNQVLFWIRPA